MNDLAFISDGADSETGFLGWIADRAAGGPQKRRRTREALAEAARAKTEAARLRQQAVDLAQEASPAPAATAGIADRFTRPTALFGLPGWQVGLIAGVAAWAVSPVVPKTVGVVAAIAVPFALPWVEPKR